MIKMVGVGMLVAVLLDATVVRALLVPATMRLLGRSTGGPRGRSGAGGRSTATGVVGRGDDGPRRAAPG